MSVLLQRLSAAMAVEVSLIYSGRTVHGLLSLPYGGIRYHSRGELAQIQLTSHGTSRYPATTHVSGKLIDIDQGLGITWNFLGAATARSWCAPVRLASHVPRQNRSLIACLSRACQPNSTLTVLPQIRLPCLGDLLLNSMRTRSLRPRCGD